MMGWRCKAAPREQTAGPARIRVGELNTWVETRFPDGSKPAWKRAVTPRQALAEWITRRDNPWFARAAVNRLWHYFFGKSPRSLAERIEELYLVALSRKPRPQETKRLLEYAAGHESKEALRDLFWALLNSTEFILNH